MEINKAESPLLKRSYKNDESLERLTRIKKKDRNKCIWNEKCTIITAFSETKKRILLSTLCG